MFKDFDLNIENIYYNKYPKSWRNFIFYYDKDKYILKNLSNLINKTSAESIVEDIKQLEQNFENKEYATLLSSAPEGFRVELINRLIIESEIINDNLFKSIFSVYVSADYGFSNLDKSSMLKLFKSKSSKLKEETFKKISHLPQKVTVYRGQCFDSTDYKDAYSWTTLPGIAAFFASRNPQKDCKIIKGYVDKDDIIEYLSGEAEVVAMPNDIKDVEIIDLYGANISEEIDDENLLYIKEHYNIYEEHLERILANTKSWIHGKRHAKRVLWNSICLYTIKDVENIFYEHTDCDDIKILAYASIYHDIGRGCDDVDDLHGAKSAKTFREDSTKFMRDSFSEKELDIIEFLIKYHSLDDEIALKALENYDEEDREYIKGLFFILKDSDGLDRFRLGRMELNFTFLRNEEAVKLIPVAFWASDDEKYFNSLVEFDDDYDDYDE